MNDPDDAWVRLEIMDAQRRALVGQLEAFIRYRHRLGTGYVALRENWDARGPDTVWMAFKPRGGVGEVRFAGSYDQFEDWRLSA
jgi:hypothetical protein